MTGLAVAVGVVRGQENLSPKQFVWRSAKLTRPGPECQRPVSNRARRQAHRRLIECFTVASEVGFAELTAYALGVAADLALSLDDPDTAATLLEAAREHFGRIGGAPQAHEVERHERVAARVDELLDDPEQAFARGRDLRPDEAVAIAFALDPGRD